MITHIVHLAGGVVWVEVAGEANARLGVGGVFVVQHPCGGREQTQQSEGSLGNVCVLRGWYSREAFEVRQTRRKARVPYDEG